MIGTARFQHTERGYGHPLTTWYQNGYHILIIQSPRGDIACDAVAYLIHLSVGVSFFLIDHRDVVGRLLGLLAEQRDDGLCVIVIHVGLIETVEDCRLMLIQERYALQGCFRLTDEGGDGLAYTVGQVLHHTL